MHFFLFQPRAHERRRVARTKGAGGVGFYRGGGRRSPRARENDILITAGNIYRRFSLPGARVHRCARHLHKRFVACRKGREGGFKSPLSPAATLTSALDIAFLSFDVGRMSITNVIIWMPEGRGTGEGGGREEKLYPAAEFFPSRGTRSRSILSRFIQR